MKTYSLTVTVQESNPEYKPEVGSYYRKIEESSPLLETRHLQVSLTEQEFQVVKEAIVKFWEAENQKGQP